MYNAPTPPPGELPSTRALLRSTFIAVVTAVILLVTVVLPAEYGIDPTGIGRPLGLTRMGEIKVALAREAAADAAADSAAAAAASLEGTRLTTTVESSDSANITAGDLDRADRGRAEVVEVLLQPGEGREFKLAMKAGAQVSYEWFTDWGVVNFDLHGDPLDAPAGFYHGYAKGTGRTSDKGVLTAAFEGVHGWFWRNRGTEPLTVTLRVEGDYSELREIK